MENAVAEAEGQPEASSTDASSTGAIVPPAPPARAPSTPAPPPTADQAAWGSAIARDIESLDQRSRQLLAVRLLHNDPREKSQDLIAHMQWCDEGSLRACLHAGHVLMFNECLFDRGYVLYRKAEMLAAALPSAAIDHITVDGRPQRYELQSGLQLGDPAGAGDGRRDNLLGVCGAAAERDRRLWDEMFARYDRGERTAPAAPSTTEERLALGAIRKQMLIDAHEHVDSLARLHAGAAADIRARLVGTASALCAQGDLVSCGTESSLHAAGCRLDPMMEAYQRFQAGLASLDPASRRLAQEVAQDVIGPAKAYSEGNAMMRELLRQSICETSR